MLTIDQIQDDVNSAKLYYIQQLKLVYANMQNGFGSSNPYTGIKRLITSLTFQINANLIDANTDALYACLMEATAGFTGNYQIDPSVIIPGQNITVIITPNSPFNIERSSADLIEDGEDTGNWYLPLKNDDGSNMPLSYKPTLLTLNGNSFPPTYSINYMPMRLYGFANNTDEQTIIVTITPTVV